MDDLTQQATGVTVPVAAALALAPFVIPISLSASSAPSPAHPATMAWYLALRTPSFKPPDWIFPVAWTAIEAGLTTAAYRLLRSPPSRQRTAALSLLGWNVFWIGGWSRLFFRNRNLGASTVAAASMVVTSGAFVHAARPVDRTAARAGLPLVGWVTFATVLTATIWQLNRSKP